MKSRRWLQTLSVLMTLVLFTGCAPVQPGSGDTKPKETGTATASAGKKVVRHNLGSDPETLDPGQNTAVDGAMLLGNLFEGLTRTDKDEKAIPGIAEKWDVSDDQLTYTFHLRDAKWSDGKKVVAGDFEYAWKRALDPLFAAEYAYMLYYIQGAEEYNAGKGKAEDIAIKAKDESTLEVSLKAPVPYFLQLCAFPTYFPVRKDIVEKDPEKWTLSVDTYICNGPFKLNKWAHNDKIVMVRNDNYYAAADVKIDEIDFSMINEQSTSLAAYENNEIDVTEQVPNEKIAALKDNPDFQIASEIGTAFWCFNVTKAPFDNINVRKAFSAALDKQVIIDNVTKGEQKVATGFVPLGMKIVGDKDFRDIAGDYGAKPNADPEAAKKYLAEAGYPDGKGLPPIEFLYNTSENIKSMAEAYQNMVKQNLGVDIALRNEEWKVFQVTRNEGNFQIARHGWTGDFVDPMTFLDMWISTSGNNDAQWKNPQYDKLISDAKMEKDAAKRADLMAQAEKLLMDEAVVVPIYYNTRPIIIRKNIQNLHRSVLGFIFYRDADITQ